MGDLHDRDLPPRPRPGGSGAQARHQGVSTSLQLPLLPPPRPAPAPPAVSLTRAIEEPPALDVGAAAAPASELLRLVEAFAIAGVENEHTRRSYRAHLERLLGMTGARRLADLTIGDLLAIRTALTSSALASASQAVAIFALRSFLRWAESVGQRLPFDLQHARAALKPPRIVPAAAPAILSDAECHRVIGAARDADGQRAMVLVLLGAGLRIEELCKLDCADLVNAASCDPKIPAVLRIRGKRSKVRFVPLLAPVIEGLIAYLAATGRTTADQGPIFLAHDSLSIARGERRRIGVRSTRKRISKLFRTQGIAPAICVHGTRHTFSTAVIANGGTLKDLADLLGHASIVTTARYVSRLGADLAELLGRMPTNLVAGAGR